MPFKSEKQRRYLWANEPEVAQRWSEKYGNKPMNRDRPTNKGRERPSNKGREQPTNQNPRYKRKPERVTNRPTPLARPNLSGGKPIPHPPTRTKPASGNSRLRDALEKKK